MDARSTYIPQRKIAPTLLVAGPTMTNTKGGLRSFGESAGVNEDSKVHFENPSLWAQVDQKFVMATKILCDIFLMHL